MHVRSTAIAVYNFMQARISPQIPTEKPSETPSPIILSRASRMAISDEYSDPEDIDDDWLSADGNSAIDFTHSENSAK
jgi:hypothetical protein